MKENSFAVKVSLRYERPPDMTAFMKRTFTMRWTNRNFKAETEKYGFAERIVFLL